MTEPVVIAIIVAAGQILGQTAQALLHRKHERLSRDTNDKVNGQLGMEFERGYQAGLAAALRPSE